MSEFVLDAALLCRALDAVSAEMTANRDYLVELDSRAGDGDLGVSMDNGYRAVSDFLKSAQEKDLGRLLMQCSRVFNEASPSSLGTITSFGFMGMARKLKGLETADLAQLAEAMANGAALIMDKAGSKPGEKTILDSLCPGIEALKAAADQDAPAAFAAAAKAAADGAESTRDMRSVHGRAAYYSDGGIGHVDGGAVVGKLIFEALASVCSD